jgi:hypothetical protein
MAVPIRVALDRVSSIAPIATTPAKINRPITAPRLWWKSAKKAVTKPPRPFMFKRKRKSGGGALPWRLPKPMTTDQRIWADYLAFKAAGLLETWFELYRDVLGLEPPPEPEP